MCIEELQRSKCAKTIRKAAQKENFDFFKILNKSKHCKKLEASCSIHGCGKKTLCQKQVEEYDESMVGMFKPSCDQNGNFADIQSHGSTGYQWCPIVPELSAEPLAEHFKFREWEVDDADYEKWTETCEKLKNSKCAQQLADQSGKKFSLKKAIKKAKACKKLIKDKDCSWKTCQV